VWDVKKACRVEQALSKRIAGSASRLAGEIEKLHLEPRGEGERKRKRCKETLASNLRSQAKESVTEEQAMRVVLSAMAMSAALLATDASAQGVNLTGPLAFVTQNGWELNLVNEVGEPSRGWLDYPGRLSISRA